MARSNRDLFNLEATRSPLVIPVDYASSIDPDPEGWFCSQRDVDLALRKSGATAFKHLQAVWDVLPPLLRHGVTINLAAGVHRPRNPETNWGAWQLGGKIVMPGVPVDIQINGAPPSQYTQLVSSLTVSTTSGGSDPYVEFSGTPFSGMDLRGMFVIFDTGQTTVINKNTSNRLYVEDVLSPTPTSGFVGKPSTILRNSYDDASGTPNCYYGVMTDLNYPSGMSVPLQLGDMEVAGFGCDELMVSNGSVYGLRVLVDHAANKNTFGATPAWSCVTALSRSSSIYMRSSALKGDRLATVPGTGSRYNFYNIGGYMGFFQSYAAGTQYGVHVAGETGEFSSAMSVYDYVASAAMEVLERARLTLSEWGDGRTNIIRSSGAGIAVWGDALFTEGDQFMEFENVTGPCVQLSGYAGKIGTEYGYSVRLVNGAAGGNGDVGISFSGQKGWARLRADTTVSGALGEVRFNGTISTYAQIQSTGPFVDTAANFCRVTA